MQQKQKIKVYRTTEGTIFEVLFVLLLIITWVMIVRFLSSAPDIVPSHFDATGQANRYGSKYAILFPCVITSVVGFCLMLGAYFPNSINMPIRVSTPRQYTWVIRMTRILGIMMLPLTFVIAWTSLASQRYGGPSAIPILSVVGIMLAVVIGFSIVTYKMR